MTEQTKTLSPAKAAKAAMIARQRVGAVDAMVHGVRGIQAANDLTVERREAALTEMAQAFGAKAKSKPIVAVMDAQAQAIAADLASRKQGRADEAQKVKQTIEAEKAEKGKRPMPAEIAASAQDGDTSNPAEVKAASALQALVEASA